MANVAAYGFINRVPFKEWRSSRRCKWIVLLVIWSLSAYYVKGFYNRGWVPHDEGALAQSAERVLSGELPHRDFDEIYTGGLTFLHSLAFKFLGTTLISLRVVLLAFFLAFVPVCYLIALRFTEPAIAGLVTILAVVWSVPNYFASIPSWYNLFFAIFGILTLIWHIESRRVEWLFVAGFFGGLSVLAKITGLYYLAAVFLFLLYREQQLTISSVDEPREVSRLYFVSKALVLSLFVALLILILRGRLGLMEIFHFVLPQVVICGVLLWSEWQEEPRRQFSSRIKTLFGLLWPFGIGAVIPIAIFFSVYLWNNAVGDLYQGVFILSQKRLEYETADFPPFLTVITCIPYAALVFIPFSLSFTESARPWLLTLVILVGLALYFSGTPLLYYSIWQSARLLGVIAVLTGCVLLARTRMHLLFGQDQRQMLFLLLSMTALLGLVQFPFAKPVYFLYIAPLVCLALCGVVSMQEKMPKLRHLVALLFYLTFAVMWTNPYVWAIGLAYVPFGPESVLTNQKGRLKLNDYDNRLYTELVTLIRGHSKSPYIYAAPDCPEVYFLSGMHNPTRKIFDFLSDSENSSRFVMRLLNEKHINLVVLNRTPHFSKPLNPQLVAMIAEHFSHSVNVGHFTVRWKE